MYIPTNNERRVTAIRVLGEAEPTPITYAERGNVIIKIEQKEQKGG